jgi:hypothetical protein
MLRYEQNPDVQNRRTRYVAQRTKIKRQNRKYRKKWKVFTSSVELTFDSGKTKA